MTPRRELLLAVLLCVVGAGLTLYAVSRVWVELAVVGGLTIDELSIPYRGTENAGFAKALSIVALAGVLALAATRRSGRVVVGTLITLAGGWVAIRMLVFLSDFTRNASACHGNCAPTDVVASHPAWGATALVGAVLMTAGGLLTALRGRHWPALGSSYESAAPRLTEREVTDKGVWDALDQGHDPTA